MLPPYPSLQLMPCSGSNTNLSYNVILYVCVLSVQVIWITMVAHSDNTYYRCAFISKKATHEINGKWLCHFLYPSCSWRFKRPNFTVEIREKKCYIFFHLLTPLTKMFGLGQKACTTATLLLTDTKAINQNLILSKNPKFSRIYGKFYEIFKHQVVLVGMHSAQAISLIETQMKGLVIQLD